MPMYDYKCECGLSFEALVRKKEDAAEQECPACGEAAAKEFGSGFLGFMFGSGQTPGNTGVDSLDSKIDKLVGRDADERWEEVKDRESHKRSVRKDRGKRALKKNPDGSYDSMEEEELDRSKKITRKYNKIYKEHQEWRKENDIPKFEE